MSGPISTTKLTADSKPDPTYSQHSVTITFNFDAMHMPMVDLNVVEKMLTVDHWNDGRYPFSTEMIHEGVGRLLKQAIYDAVSLKMQDRYKDEVVVSDDGNSQTARWYIETDKAMKGVYVGILDSIKEASIGRPVKR